MIERDQDLYLLRLSGEEGRSLEDKRWFLLWTSLAPLIGLSVAYAVQLRQEARDPFVIYGFPVVGSLLLCAILWNLLGGYSRLLELAAVGVVVALALTQNVFFALEPALPPVPLYLNTGSYWTVAVDAAFVLLVLPLRWASRLILLLFCAVVALPWLLNFAAFEAFAGPLLRAQALLFTLLVSMICLAWYRERFVERATEALLLRELALSDPFAHGGQSGQALTPSAASAADAD